jgi:hypothetical protein
MAHEIILRVKDVEMLMRQFTLICATAKDPAGAAQVLLKRFKDDLALYPYQWPVQNEPPTEDEWRGCGVIVRYRRVPADHLVEVLEIRQAPDPRKKKQNAEQRKGPQGTAGAP